MLGSGHILVQRYGDILSGKRTWQKELSQSNVSPTLPDAVAGDITAAIPYRAMTNIINFIHAVDHVVPGFASNETLLYSPELKFYSNRVKMTKEFETNIKGLYCLGDSSGWTRGLMMASAMGILMGRRLVLNLEDKLKKEEIKIGYLKWYGGYNSKTGHENHFGFINKVEKDESIFFHKKNIRALSHLIEQCQMNKNNKKIYVAFEIRICRRCKIIV